MSQFWAGAAIVALLCGVPLVVYAAEQFFSNEAVSFRREKARIKRRAKLRALNRRHADNWGF